MKNPLLTNAGLTYYRRLSQSLSRLLGTHVLSKLDREFLSEVIRRDREVLGRIENWVPPRLIEDSIFRYGVNPNVEKLLNSQLDSDCTHADLLAYFGRKMKGPCRYLELGVSVGKTLWQILNTCGPCDCWGFDIEELTPVLKQHFVQQSREEWPSPENSIKKAPSSISRFIHPDSGSKITYISADIFDARAWQLLANGRFNLVLSDALHTPEALDFEWQQMTTLNIFDPNEVVIMWDDLDGNMRDWFDRKSESIASHLHVGRERVGLHLVNGWLGNAEFPHRLGFALKTPAPNL